MQPEVFKLVKVYTPLVVYVTPFQLYESHSVAFTLLLKVPGTIVKSNMLVLVQPAAFNDVPVYIPDTVYVTEFRGHEYEPHALSVRFVVVL
jgi:hypothetical protein